MKVKEIIQRVQSLYSKGVQSDSTRLSSRHIFSKLVSSRARLIVYKVNKRQQVSQWYYQSLNCVEMIKAPLHECPCVPPSGCTILRSKFPLPKPLTGLTFGHMLQSVSSLEGDTTYSETTWNAKKFKKGSKFTSRKPDYYIRNNYIYITCTTVPKVISIVGLFEDPLVEITQNNYCEDENENSCISPLDMNFPVEQDMVDTLVEMAVQELLGNPSQGRDHNRYETEEDQRHQQPVENQQRQKR